MIEESQPDSEKISKTVWIVLAFILLTHFALANFYASVTPYRQSGIDLSMRGAKIADIGAPDERAHANYVQWILDGKGWPVLDLAKMKSDPVFRAEEYESHQPPLYYLIEAATAKVSGVDQVRQQRAKLPLRFPNTIFGAATVAGVFFLAVWAFSDPVIGLLAALVPALLPMSTALSGAISNDPLLICLSTWALSVMVHCLKNGWTNRKILVLVLLISAACWTKTTGLLLIPTVLVAAFLPTQTKIKPYQLGAACLGFLVLTSALWIHNQIHYGDPFAASAFNNAFSDTPQHSMISQVIATQGGNPTIDYWTKWVGWWTFRSFIGVFGYMDIWLNRSGSPYPSHSDPNWLYSICLLVGLILAFGWSQYVKSAKGKQENSVHISLITFFFLVTGSFLAFNNHYFQAQGRYLYPAIGPISVGLALGAFQFFRHRKWTAVILLAIGLTYLQFDAVTTVPHQFSKRIVMTAPPQSVYTMKTT